MHIFNDFKRILDERVSNVTIPELKDILLDCSESIKVKPAVTLVIRENFCLKGMRFSKLKLNDNVVYGCLFANLLNS